jgi:hypothetical protein
MIWCGRQPFAVLPRISRLYALVRSKRGESGFSSAFVSLKWRGSQTGLTRRAGERPHDASASRCLSWATLQNDLAQGVVDESIALGPKETKVVNLEILSVVVFISPITF